MNAEILSTGDEVCTGKVVDTNAAHIAAGLQDIGLTVTRHSTVGDDMASLCRVLSEIAQRSDIAIVTGGLGPTVDDLTAEAASRAAGVDCVLNQDALDGIQRLFAAYSRSMAVSDEKQARLPEGATPIFNPAGTAPGFVMGIGQCRFYFLPGVPREMIRMFSSSVVPDILSFRGEQGNVHLKRELSLFGLPEARVNDRLAGFSERFPSVKLGMMARFPVITVKLTAHCPSSSTGRAALTEEMDTAARFAEDRLGEAVFDRKGRSMETVVADLLSTAGATVAVAESCTGGLISHLLTNVAGSSAYFLFSGVTYANQAKSDVLGVSEETIRRFGAVSGQTAAAMAAGVRRISGAIYGLATTGVAGPAGGSAEKPVGTVWVAVSSPQGEETCHFYSPFRERLANKQIFAMWALDLLRKRLLKERQHDLVG